LEHRQQKFAGSPAEAAGLFHPDAESIHPFAGSGRTGRPLMDLELMQSGYPTIDGKFTDRRRYYDAYCRSGGAEAKTPAGGEVCR
jgi:Fic family protein